MKFNELIDGINKYELRYAYEEYEAPWSYHRTIEKIDVTLEALLSSRPEDGATHLEALLKPFLIYWGKLSSVVERVTNDEWGILASILCDIYNRSEFERLKGEKLVALDLDGRDAANAVRIVYGRLQLVPNLGNSTCLSKILHVLNSSVFAMWDSEVRQLYKGRHRLICDTAEGYLEFLRIVQVELQEALGDYYVHAPMVKSNLELNDKDKLLAMERAGWACELCGSRLGLCIDYVVPKSRRGTDDWANNSRVLCLECKMGVDYRFKTLVKLIDEYNVSKITSKNP